MNDLALDDNMDLQVFAGDLLIGDGEQQCQQSILIAAKGNFRRWPAIGVNVLSFLKSRFTLGDKDTLRQKVKLNLEYDGYTDVAVTINSATDIQINATR
jgi:hypothetical protein